MKVHKPLFAFAILALLLSAASYSSAESNSDCEPDNFTLVLGIIENPDPIPQAQWSGYEGDPEENDGGRDDGRPDIGFDDRGQPRVVWAFDTGTDHDIAFTEWNENGWAPDVEFLTAKTVDELDPRIFVDDAGSLFVTWWENTPQQSILYAWRDVATGQWSPPIHVTDGGRRPSIVVWEDAVHVAYERDSAGGQEITLAIERLEGFFSVAPVAETSRTDPLDIVLHVRDGRMWMDWQHSNYLLAFSEFVAGRWVAPDTRPWNDRSWIGVLSARHDIETELFGLTD